MKFEASILEQIFAKAEKYNNKHKVKRFSPMIQHKYRNKSLVIESFGLYDTITKKYVLNYPQHHTAGESLIEMQEMLS